MAYKALNYFIDYKVGSRYIELPISKLEVLNKLIYFIKYSFKCFIRLLI